MKFSLVTDNGFSKVTVTESRDTAAMHEERASVFAPSSLSFNDGTRYMQEGRATKLEYLNCCYTACVLLNIHSTRPKTRNPNKFHAYTASILKHREP
jgi:hypothetical protein